ncbi:MAG TPA: hypothetical protein IAC20_01305 [Candidatus Faecisoma merdavium]|nr:hypothetical protein [Candidatus Faecisoma merdavium]
MDFIIENYVWFIVAFVVIVMAIIGYFADKTDFGRKIEKKEKKQNNKKNEKIKVEAKGINELTQNIVENNKDAVSTNQDENIVNIDQIKEQEKLEPMPIDNENIDQSLFAPLTDTPSKEQTNDVVNSPVELKNIEPTNINNEGINNNEKNVSEDEDIWKF